MKSRTMNLYNDPTRKIIDYFNGQLSADEEAELIQWLKLDEKNKAFFYRFKENVDPQELEHPLLESSYTELKNRLLINQEFNAKHSGKGRRIQLFILRYAAMLLIAIIAGFSAAYLMMENKSQNAEVVWFETRVPRGEKSQILLPDGSKVWVNSESSVSYPSNFMDGNREVKLNGEAYFEVAKLKSIPFIVMTNDYNIRVSGTKFNVMAYSDFNRTETSLIEGKIEIQKGEQDIPVEPGETCTFIDNQFSIKKTNASQTARWKDDIFEFEQTTFKELIVRLERWYNVDIVIKSPELNGIIYSGIFKNEETIWQVLDVIQQIHPIRYSRVDFRTFELVKKK